MDKSAFFTDLTHRNALRKAAHLPLLDFRDEMTKAAALDRLRQYEAACEAHAEDRQRIQDEVLAEYRLTRGADYTPSGLFGTMGFQTRVEKRFRAFMEIEYGVSR